MPRAASIHIGVNRPGDPVCQTLTHSEKHTWRMAELAHQAGYASLQMLLGEAATRQAVIDALGHAADALGEGDSLLVSFSGHGCHLPGVNVAERCRRDQGLHLRDGVLVDDELVECWRRFKPGVKIVAVVESCHSAGMAREDEWDDIFFPRVSSGPTYGGGVVYRGGISRGNGAPAPCISSAPADTYDIAASVLLLAASSEHQTAQDGLYSAYLLKAWNGGRFTGSYCSLHRQVCEGVMSRNANQHPQIMVLGNGSPALAEETAFHQVESGRSVVAWR